ncbi:MlaD family protein [Nocardia huaxiensis]|uniref:MCE family protein n=1 Tax=Nocardia huaxiensis TaxID=2755382 RepID=A0A7D6ZV86_9NOCA|nr:MlaD family protein [Nocardia huaxiensis]QLY29569.1 MCE family protein [Nocardia huaxiensis]UFS96867.1 MlaD family protein [Nocardia huaxiensis]
MKASSLASVASIVTILVLGSAYLTFGVVKADWFRDQVEATMTVPESGGLLPRSKVLLSGVQVGQVTSVTHVPAGVEVHFRVRGDYRIPVASAVRIEGLSGLGEAYLDFRPETADGPYLRDGQTVAATEVTAPQSIPDIARTSTELLRQLNPEALASIVDTFSTAMTGTETIVPQLSRATDLLAATLLSRTDLIREMLLAMQSRATDMDWTGPALRGAAGPWADFGPRVAEVADSITRVIRAGNAPDSFLEESPDTIGLAPFLRETAERLDIMGPEFAPLWPMLAPVLAQAPPLISRLDLGSLISQALHATTDDGTLRLQIAVK